MAEEIKQQNPVRSLRISDDVMGKFKVIQDELHLTHDSALKMLIDGYELEMAKNAIPDRETEISNFQTKASELVEAFIHSLQLNQDAEARIRSSFELQLQTKDRTIAGLHEKVDTLKAENEEQKKEITEIKEKLSVALKDAQNAEKEAQRAEASLATTNALMAAKNAEIERLTAETSTIPALKKAVEDLRAENASLLKAKDAAERTAEDMKKQAETTKKEADRDIQVAKKVFENEKKGAILEIKETYISKIEKKDGEISALKEKIAEAQRDQMLARLSAKEEIARLQEEIARLQKEIEELKNASEQKKLEGI